MELFEDAENVKVVADKKALQTEVLSSSRAVLLGAFSDDSAECEGCAAVSAEFKKAAGTLAGYGVVSVAVDCTGSLPKCHGMTQQLGLVRLPAIVGFVDPPKPNPYTRKPDRTKLPFEGSGMARTLQKHILNKIPSVLLPRQTEESWPPSFTSPGGDEEDEAEGPATSLVLLFTDRETTSPLYKALAFHYGPQRLKFAEVSSEEEVLKEKFGVTTSPTMLVVSAEEQGEAAATFEGNLKDWGEVTSFLDTHALAAPGGQDQGGGDDDSGEAKGSKKKQGENKKKGTVAKGLVASEGGAVLLTDSAEFQARVARSKDAWMVLFHDGLASAASAASTSSTSTDGAGAENGKAKEAAASWSAEAKKCEQGLISAAEVNCTATPGVCQDRKVKFPKKGPAAVVHVYGYGEKEDEDDDVMGGGGGSSGGDGLALDVFELGGRGGGSGAADAYGAAAESLPDLTFKVNAMTLDQVMAEAAKTNTLALALVSNKDEPPAMLKQLALTLQGAAQVCFFPDPDPQTLQRFQVTRTPMFVALFAQTSDPSGKPMREGEIQFGIQHFEPKRFGRPTFETVFSFAMQMAGQLNPEAVQAVVDREQSTIDALQAGGKTKASGGAQQSSGGGASAAGGSKAGAPIPEVTADNWEDICKPTSATLCAVAFLSGPQESPLFEAEMASLVAAQHARIKDPYVFMWADGNCLTDFADAFDVQPSKLPTVVAYSPKKSRYASFVGVYGEDAINDLLTGVLSGRVPTKTLYQAASPDTGKDCAALFEASQAGTSSQGDAGAEEEEEDLGDMMAEILAEEERAKAELAAEMEAEAKAAKAAEEEAAAEAEKAAAKAKKKKAAKKKAAKKKKAKKDNDL